MSFSESKSDVMTFSPRGHIPVTVTMGGKAIKQVATKQVLGAVLN